MSSIEAAHRMFIESSDILRALVTKSEAAGDRIGFGGTGTAASEHFFMSHGLFP